MPFTKNTKVEFVGDRYGNNAALDVPENIGKTGTLEDSPVIGFWWVRVGESKILAAETELKEVQ